MNLETLGILAERGYRSDSSNNDGDLPYLAGEAHGNRLVELPVFWSSSDRQYYSVYRRSSVVAAALIEDFHAMYEVGGLCTLILHPRGDYGSGRAERIHAVDALLQAIRETPRVWLATCGEIANWAVDPASTSA